MSEWIYFDRKRTSSAGNWFITEMTIECQPLHRMIKNPYLWGLLLLASLSSCKTLHLGAGVSYNSGNSGGCESETNAGIQLFTSYYTSTNSGPGISLRLFTPGYTDCNDSDPLLFYNPQIEYRQYLKNKDLSLNLGTGYAAGVFVDPGYSFAGGMTYYLNKKLFFKVDQHFYKAFQQKKNAIKPGISSNASSQISIGIRF
jgi:hypothetical protein